MRISTSMRWLVVAVSAAMLLAVVAACSSETVEVPGETVVVEKEVVKTVEVPGETVVKEVIKEVQVPGETVVVKEEVVKEVMVPGETVVVEKEVIKTVEVPGETVTVEVVKEVQVPGETVVVEKEVVKTVEVPGATVVVEKEVVKTVEVPGQTVVVEKEVIKTVPGPERVMVKEVPIGYVTDPTTGKVVSAPQYGGTITFSNLAGRWHTDSYRAHTAQFIIDGVVERPGIGDWGIDRDIVDFKNDLLGWQAATGLLAESWTQPDALTVVFKIRQGVYYHNKAPANGRELTAKDVEYYYHRQLALGSGYTEPSPTWGLVTQPIESATATDKWTVVIKLSEPRYDIVYNLLNDAHSAIYPPEIIEEHGNAEDWRTIVGTGPYELTDYVEGSSWSYTKNPDYWRFDEKYPENRLPYVDEIRAVVIAEEATKVTGLRTGQIDAVGYWGWSQLKLVDNVLSLARTNPEIMIYPWSARSESVFRVRMNEPPFNDIRVRRAMQKALNLPEINETYFKGYAAWEPLGLVGAANTAANNPYDEWPKEMQENYRYDPIAAEALLDAAGYKRGGDGIRFKTTLTHPDRHDLGYSELAAGYWARIGVDVEIDYVTEGVWNDIQVGQKLDDMLSNIWAVDSTDPAALLQQFGHSDGRNNSAVFNDPVFDAMAEAAVASSTFEERSALSKKADWYTIENHWTIWGPKNPHFNVIQPWIIGYNGEISIGITTFNQSLVRLWVDHELKAAMGY